MTALFRTNDSFSLLWPSARGFIAGQPANTPGGLSSAMHDFGMSWTRVNLIEARADGFSWAAIAAMLGVSKQIAQGRYGD